MSELDRISMIMACESNTGTVAIVPSCSVTCLRTGRKDLMDGCVSSICLIKDFLVRSFACLLKLSEALTTKPKMNQQTLLITVPFLANVALDQIRHYQLLCETTIIKDECRNHRSSEMLMLSKCLI